MSKTSISIIGSIIFGTATLTAQAERVFPPIHHHEAAQFVEPKTSNGEFGQPWYEAEVAAQREGIKQNEQWEPSPYSSDYYFVLARSYANDLSVKLEQMKNAKPHVAETGTDNSQTPDS